MLVAYGGFGEVAEVALGVAETVPDAGLVVAVAKFAVQGRARWQSARARSESLSRRWQWPMLFRALA
jgi:hypothetical protein